MKDSDELPLLLWSPDAADYFIVGFFKFLKKLIISNKIFFNPVLAHSEKSVKMCESHCLTRTIKTKEICRAWAFGISGIC
jgi:hypothetical protein